MSLNGSPRGFITSSTVKVSRSHDPVKCLNLKCDQASQGFLVQIVLFWWDFLSYDAKFYPLLRRFIGSESISDLKDDIEKRENVDCCHLIGSAFSHIYDGPDRQAWKVYSSAQQIHSCIQYGVGTHAFNKGEAISAN
jgi:hypothetical protein